jgi:putative transposase
VNHSGNQGRNLGLAIQLAARVAGGQLFEASRYESGGLYGGEDYWDGAIGEALAGLGQEGGGDVPQSWDIGAALTDEVLNREVFFSLKQAKVVIENWRREYNTIRPHSSLNYRPRTPEAILPLGLQGPWVLRTAHKRALL